MLGAVDWFQRVIAAGHEIASAPTPDRIRKATLQVATRHTLADSARGPAGEVRDPARHDDRRGVTAQVCVRRWNDLRRVTLRNPYFESDMPLPVSFTPVHGSIGSR